MSWALHVRELQKWECMKKTGRGWKLKERWRGGREFGMKRKCLRKTGRGMKMKNKMARR